MKCDAELAFLQKREKPGLQTRAKDVRRPEDVASDPPNLFDHPNSEIRSRANCQTSSQMSRTHGKWPLYGDTCWLGSNHEFE